MKKFLSLVLALIMVMSLVTVGAGAKEFTDADAITYDEAIDVISALGVVDGYSGGTFNPNGLLTRQAAAKIICNMILGPTTAKALAADAAPFPDVAANSDFAGYIAYCAKEGIINGYGDGTFRPGNPLTGYAFLKMLLGALGYDPKIEQFVGANWTVNVAKMAIGLGLTKGLNDELDGTRTVTREEAALYALNTLEGTMVEYASKTTVTLNGAVVEIGSGDAKKVTTNRTTSYNNKNDGYIQFCEEYFDKLKKSSTGSKGEDAFGRPAHTWTLKNTEIGTYADAADFTYTKDQKIKDLYADVDPKDYYTFELYVDGVQQTSFDLGSKTNKSNKDKLNTKVTTGAYNYGIGNGSLIEIFKDEDNLNGTIVVTNSYLMQVGSEYNTKDETLTIVPVEKTYSAPLRAGEETLDNDDFGNLADFRDDDYVIVTVADGVVKSIALAEKVTATVTEYVHTNGGSVTAGGTTYEYAMARNYDDQDITYTIKEEYDLYLDPYGYVIYADGVSVDKDYAFIVEFNKSSNLTNNSKVVAYAYFADGTAEEIVVNKVEGTSVKGSNIGSSANPRLDSTTYQNKWYSYNKKDNGQYDLNLRPTDGGSTIKSTGAGTPTLVVNRKNSGHTTITYATTPSNQTAQGTKNTIFLILDSKNNVKVYEGIKNVPSEIVAGVTTGTEVYVHSDSSSYAKYVFIDLHDGTAKGGNLSGDVVFFLKNKSEGNDADNDEYYVYNALVNGEETTIRVEKSVNSASLAGKLYTDIEKNSKGWIVDEGWTEVNGTTYPLTDRDTFTYSSGKDISWTDIDDDRQNDKITQKGSTLILADEDYYMADNYRIYVIKGTDVTVRTMRQLIVNQDITGSSASSAEIFGVLNSDAEYTALYIKI